MSLFRVASIRIPSLALKHRHVFEALGLATVFAVDPKRVERVIGTNNGQKSAPPDCQIYGWAPNVARHRDDTGFVYFTPLLLRYSAVHTPKHAVRLQRGNVYRLHDYATHWTIDSAPVVCLLTGPMQFPLDRIACAKLQSGVDALAAGGRDAPRVSKGFRVPLRGECWAWTGGDPGPDLVLIEEARSKSWLIARCFLCERFAVRVDEYFPMHSDNNRCARCLCERRDVPRESLEREVA